MPFHSHVLDNGLQIIGETSPSARSVALGFFVRTGARDGDTRTTSAYGRATRRQPVLM